MQRLENLKMSIVYHGAPMYIGVSSSCYLSNIAISKIIKRIDGIPDDNSESPWTMVVEQWKATQKVAHPQTKNKLEIVSCWCR